MKFIKTEPTEKGTQRLISEQGQWELWLVTSLDGKYGVGALKASHETEPGFIRFYDCGGEATFAQHVLRAIQDIFWVIPEEATAQAVEEELPGDGGNITNNGIWDTLRHMARMIRYVRQQTQSKGAGI